MSNGGKTAYCLLFPYQLSRICGLSRIDKLFQQFALVEGSIARDSLPVILLGIALATRLVVPIHDG
jgi:hypothetical protein